MVDGGKSASFSSLTVGERLNGLAGSKSVWPLLSRVRQSRSSLQRSKLLLLLLPFVRDDAPSFFDDATECVAALVEDDVCVEEVIIDNFVDDASDDLEGAGERFPLEDAAAEWDPPFRMLKRESKLIR